MGIEYVQYARRGIMERLPGCHRDVDTISKLLTSKYHVNPKNITVLSDAYQSSIQPTKRNILNHLASLLSASGKPQLWFFYSGHGSNRQDAMSTASARDEIDSVDETIVPCDVYENGQIVDDEIRGLLTQHLRDDGAQFTAVYDSCHSGSVTDLPWAFQAPAPDVRIATSLSTASDDVFHTKRGQILSLSACADPQTSVSAFGLNGKRVWQGAMTYALNSVLSADSANDKMNGADLISRVGAVIKSQGYDQITTLSTNKDVNHSNQLTFPFA